MKQNPKQKKKTQSFILKWPYPICFSIGGGCCSTTPVTMNCLSWNCRRLGNQQRARELSELVRAKGPNLVFLMETKKKNLYMEKIQCRLKFDNMFLVPRRNLNGSLALFWMNDLDLHIHTFSPHHIDAVVNPRVNDTWQCTGFYGASKTVNWEDSWSLLHHLNTQYDLSWVCIDDFNEITRLEEKSWGALRSNK